MKAILLLKPRIFSLAPLQASAWGFQQHRTPNVALFLWTVLITAELLMFIDCWAKGINNGLLFLLNNGVLVV